jgi:hypothetical protein
MYWILDIAGEEHTIWDLWISGLQECKGNGYYYSYLKSGKTFISFQWGPKKIDFFFELAPARTLPPPEKLVGGGLMSPKSMEVANFVTRGIANVGLVYMWKHGYNNQHW